MRFVSFLATVLAVGLLMPAVAAPTPPQPPPVPDGSPIVMPGDAPDLLLLYTGDVIGYLNPCG